MKRSDLRVVIDTNVIVSAVLFEGSHPAQAVELAITECQVLLSAEVEEELAEVLGRKKFDRYLPEEDRFSFLVRFRGISELVAVTERITECRDPKDDKFLELAVSGRASLVISKDIDLMVLNPFRNIPIVSPTEFLASFSVKG